MKKMYEKNELNFALIWIGVYVVSATLAENLSGTIGIKKIITAPLFLLLSIIIYTWLRRNKLMGEYGMRGMEGKPAKYLYFIPLVLLVVPNLWGGVKLNDTVLEAGLAVIGMFGAGFLEEVILRGFLFKALCKDNVKRAIVISSLSFGLGHLTNLLNGRGTFETVLQVCYASAIGFLFTIIFYYSKCLWPCIVAHIGVNVTSIFADRTYSSAKISIIGSIFLCVVALLYAYYILKKQGEREADSTN